MKYKTREPRLASALLLLPLLLFMSGPATVEAQERVDTTIRVLYAAGAEGEPGNWTFHPERVIIEPNKTIQYLLDERSTDGWGFQKIAIGENEPDQTDYIDADSTGKVMRLGSLLVVAPEFSDQRIIIRFEGKISEEMAIGVLLTVGNGDREHTSRDPQVILKPGGS